MLCRGKKPLSATHPHLLEEWDYKNNGSLTPDDVSFGSGKRVWWCCVKCGWTWSATVNKRTACNSGCPACSGRVVTGDNNLVVRCPEVVSEWDSKKNGDLWPAGVSFGSHKKAWWLCGECGNSWQAVIKSRVYGRGCPVCKGVVVSDKNRFSTVYPELSGEWHPIKNGFLTPATVSAGSDRKVWWLCGVCKYEWQATPYDRVRGRGCSACTGHVVTDSNRLSTKYPELVPEWDFERNTGITPASVSYGSNRPVWWRCAVCGHSWSALVYNRAGRKSGCPECSKSFTVSRTSQEWLTEQGVPQEDREVQVSCGTKKLLVDGFDPRTNTVYEYFGYFWHGHPDFYSPDKTNPRTHTTFGFLYNQTMERIDLIRKSGYSLVYVWGK